MIAKAVSISHGLANLQYISGESRSKEHPELITRIFDNLLPSELDASGIWELIREKAQMKKNVIKIELSPTKEYTAGFKDSDWIDLWNDFIKEYDAIEFKDKNGEVYSHKTNMAGSMFTVWLHEEAKSGIPHLHAVVCRKDKYGMTNNDHNIMARAHLAAERVCRKRGWVTAAEVHESRSDVVRTSKDCMDVLRTMPKWSWADYALGLQKKGYAVKERRDKNGALRGYTVSKDGKIFKASQLGKGRNLMASKIEATWKKLHEEVREESRRTPIKPVVILNSIPQRPSAEYSVRREGTVKYELPNGSSSSTYFIPKPVIDLFDEMFDYRETANWQDLTNMAVAFFVGLTALDTTPSGGSGGGAGNDSGWRDRKDEDELERARSCAQFAIAKIGKTPKSRKR